MPKKTATKKTQRAKIVDDTTDTPSPSAARGIARGKIAPSKMKNDVLTYTFSKGVCILLCVCCLWCCVMLCVLLMSIRVDSPSIRVDSDLYNNTHVCYTVARALYCFMIVLLCFMSVCDVIWLSLWSAIDLWSIHVDSNRFTRTGSRNVYTRIVCVFGCLWVLYVMFYDDYIQLWCNMD